MTENAKTSRLSCRGRTINHLGVQMYQSPVMLKDAMIANWRYADAEGVEIAITRERAETAEIVVDIDAIGMTFGKFCYKARTHHYSRTVSPRSPL